MRRRLMFGSKGEDVNYLTFTAQQANSSVTLNDSSSLNPTMEYNDGNGWKNYTLGTEISLTSVGDKVQFRGDNASLSYGAYKRMKFAMTGKIAASGSVMTLFDKKDELRTVKNYMCCDMFYNCTSLTTPPELPAMTLANSCYFEMFYGCSSLVNAPELPATTLANSCYERMFIDCISLTTPPELPATALANYCYDRMFVSCTNIKLSTTKTGVYQTPYRIPSVGTGTTATDALRNMFSSTGGTFEGTPTINKTYYGAW